MRVDMFVYCLVGAYDVAHKRPLDVTEIKFP